MQFTYELLSMTQLVLHKTLGALYCVYRIGYACHVTIDEVCCQGAPCIDALGQRRLQDASSACAYGTGEMQRRRVTF